MENIIRITGSQKQPVTLPMGGTDREGNVYGVDSISMQKNGKRFFPIMGEFHFSRFEPDAWKEELLKMRAGGVGIVATYVLWIHHEEKQGEWDFSGCRDLRAFLEVCREISMPVWLRVGPWAHGECRNGGFPDWVLTGGFETRTDDPVYLELVKEWYGKIGDQAKGMMCGDGGPVIGVQIENEYGHCGGPSDLEEGMNHLRTLKQMAREAGLNVPYYTATGWGGAYVPDFEMLPVLSGYVDAPWAEHVQEMPASANFLFQEFMQDENVGSDLKRYENSKFTFSTDWNPYLTAELGSGLQVTSHRRTHPTPGDIEAQALCVLGGGAVLLGYYMYHGGINPDGKYSTLQESRATGYSNDVPVKSYDFQACIRQSGEINESFGRLKRLHLMLEDFGEILAGTDTYFPQWKPESPEDLHTLRVTARVNRMAGVGFLFLNNHQRKRRMEAHTDFEICIQMDGSEMVLPHLYVKDGECGVIPFLLPESEGITKEEYHPFRALLPECTNAFLLCRLGKRCFFRSDLEKPYFRWSGEPSDVVVFGDEESKRIFRIGDKLYLAGRVDSCLITCGGEIRLLTKATSETILIYGEEGGPEKVTVENQAVDLKAGASLLRETMSGDGILEYREYLVKIEEVPTEQIHQLYLEIDYAGDRAEVYQNAKLMDDWFTTGEKWRLALKRFGYPKELTIRIYPSDKPIPNPYGNQVYYDLPVENGCVLHGVQVLPEYEAVLGKVQR